MQCRELERRKALVGLRDIKVSMSDRRRARLPLDTHSATAHFPDQFRHLMERRGSTRRDIEHALASMENALPDEPAHIANVNVIALFLTLPKQFNRLAFCRQPQEAIRTVPIVRIVRAIEQRRPEDGA